MFSSVQLWRKRDWIALEYEGIQRPPPPMLFSTLLINRAHKFFFLLQRNGKPCLKGGVFYRSSQIHHKLYRPRTGYVDCICEIWKSVVKYNSNNAPITTDWFIACASGSLLSFCLLQSWCYGISLLVHSKSFLSNFVSLSLPLYKVMFCSHFAPSPNNYTERQKKPITSTERRPLKSTASKLIIFRHG